MSKEGTSSRFSFIELIFSIKRNIFSSASIYWTLLCSIIISILYFEFDFKNRLSFPYTEHETLEQIAINHAEKGLDFYDISDLPSNVDYTFTITKDSITSTYSMPTSNKYFSTISVTLTQEISNLETIEISREIDENNYISEYRSIIIPLNILLIWIFLLISGIIFYAIINGIEKIYNFMEEKKFKKKYKDYYIT